MSLNGLDDPAIKEAHETAVAEPGGWLLLKYISRDEVDLLGRGTGGIVDIRDNIAQYEEASPLFGFLRYRRRSVVIKYMPEECSRLVQARATVHFTTICDRLGPCDATFSIASAKELKDSQLSAACSLHADSGSTSSSDSSLRSRQLMEIAEEEEEERERNIPSAENDERPQTALGATAPVAYADAANFGEAGLSPFSDVTRPSSPAKSFDHAARPMTAQRGRDDTYSYSSYPYSKPRVKLAPRPTVDTNGRQSSAAGGEPNRPVSNLPAGFKVSKSSKRGILQADVGNLTDAVIDSDERRNTMLAPLARPIPENSPLDLEPQRPHTSNGAVTTSAVPAGLPALPSPPAAQKPAMTLEKLRLMKALKLREMKKKDEMAVPSRDPIAQEPEEQPASHAPPSQPREIELPGAAIEQEVQKLVSLDGRVSSKADSGIDLELVNDQLSVKTRTESHPTSPVAPFSDVGDSTHASSLSEATDTDETLLAADHKEDAVTEVDGTIAEEAEPSDEQEKAVAEEVTASGAEDDSTRDHTDQNASARQRQEPRSFEVDAKLVTEEANHATDEKMGTTQGEAVQGNNQAPQSDQIPVFPSEFSTTPPLAPRIPADEPDTGNADATGTSTASRSVTQLKIPMSKFSTQDSSKSATPSPSESFIPVVVATEIEPDMAPTVAKKAESPETSTETDIRNPKRRAAVEPIRTDVEGQRRSGSLVYDDDLMDELQSATLQEAKPMMVSKSPITSPPSPAKKAMATEPNRTLTLEPATMPRMVRTSSTPVGAGQLLAPRAGAVSSVRAVSSNAALKPKSSKIGMGIADRIKALEKSTSNTSSTEAAGHDRPSSAFFAVRRSVGDLSRSPSFCADTVPPSPNRSRDSSPEVDRLARIQRSASLTKRLSVFEGGNAPRGEPESIQVTARIVRNPGHVFPRAPDPRADPADFTPLDLQQSVLVVDHLKDSPSADTDSTLRPEPPTRPAEKKSSLLQRRLSKKGGLESRDDGAVRNGAHEDTDTEGKGPRRRSSLTIVRDFIKDRRESMRGGSTDNLSQLPANGLISPTFSTKSHLSSRPPSAYQNPSGFSLSKRLSRSRRSSLEQQNTPNESSQGRSPSVASVDSDNETRPSDTSPNASGSNRASRFMRRLSRSLSVKNKTPSQPSISATVAEEEPAEVAAAASARYPQPTHAYQPNPIVAYMGDVNVQFPDTLLWKRRAMCLDSQGFLLLDADSSIPSLSRNSSHDVGNNRSLRGDGRNPTMLPGISGGPGFVRRFHMTDFHLPYMPEVETQELPNSVVLDFVGGSGLQVACEDRAGQIGVLRILLDAHRKHTTVGQ